MTEETKSGPGAWNHQEIWHTGHCIDIGARVACWASTDSGFGFREARIGVRRSEFTEEETCTSEDVFGLVCVARSTAARESAWVTAAKEEESVWEFRCTGRKRGFFEDSETGRDLARSPAPAVTPSDRRRVQLAGLKDMPSTALARSPPAPMGPTPTTTRVFSSVIEAHLAFRLVWRHVFSGAKERAAALEAWHEARMPIGVHPFRKVWTYASWVSFEDSDFNLHMSNSSYVREDRWPSTPRASASRSRPSRHLPLQWVGTAYLLVSYHFIREIPMLSCYEVNACRVLFRPSFIPTLFLYPLSPPLDSSLPQLVVLRANTPADLGNLALRQARFRLLLQINESTSKPLGGTPGDTPADPRAPMLKTPATPLLTPSSSTLITPGVSTPSLGIKDEHGRMEPDAVSRALLARGARHFHCGKGGDSALEFACAEARWLFAYVAMSGAAVGPARDPRFAFGLRTHRSQFLCTSRPVPFSWFALLARGAAQHTVRRARGRFCAAGLYAVRALREARYPRSSAPVLARFCACAVRLRARRSAALCVMRYAAYTRAIRYALLCATPTFADLPLRAAAYVPWGLALHRIASWDYTRSGAGTELARVSCAVKGSQMLCIARGPPREARAEHTLVRRVVDAASGGEPTTMFCLGGGPTSPSGYALRLLPFGVPISYSSPPLPPPPSPSLLQGRAPHGAARGRPRCERVLCGACARTHIQRTHGPPPRPTGPPRTAMPALKAFYAGGWRAERWWEGAFAACEGERQQRLRPFVGAEEGGKGGIKGGLEGVRGLA
ncbi:hypothetical protein FB451DRAFT_1177206 [Mycena latifolia]|nr:hypothetical protein FB451DRAFT_1177206 [Mycena latifolia]